MKKRFLLLCSTALVGAGCGADGGSNSNSGFGATGGAPGYGGQFVQGAGGQVVQGAGGFVQGAGGFVQGAGGFVQGAGGFVQGAGGFVQGAGGFVQGAGGQVTPGSGGDTAAGGSVGTGGAPSTLPNFSFFATSLIAMQRVSGSQAGFGGDLRFGETGTDAGLRGADKICTTIAEGSMPGSGQKQWKAFLSTSTTSAIDRVGEGPWYDRLGRVFAMSKADLPKQRPGNADAAIVDDFPNEDGVPNHAPDPGAGQVDNHDFLTGSNAEGRYYGTLGSTCNDWTSAVGSTGKPRVGHSWPRYGGPGGPGGFGGSFTFPGGGAIDMAHWISSLDEAGCAPGVNIIEMGPPNPANPTVGSGGGYGGIYCFALTP